MSGDVQPRKRKDKKKKRESLDARKSEGELIFSRKSSLQDDEASHGVHVTKMGSDDVLLHVHEEHGTGGHWCAKIIFFSLMAILMGLVCLIILENRGISDVDTPLSESRFSNYFDGWVDEHRVEHDDHHNSHDSTEHNEHDDDNDEHDEDEEHDDEPFEEEADHSEGDDDAVAEEDDNVTPEEDDDDDGDNVTAENITAEQEEEEDDEDNDEEDDEDNVTAEVDDDNNVTAEEADDDNATAEDENNTNEATGEQNEDEDAVEEDNDNDDNDDDDDDNDNNTNDDDVTKETSNPTSQGAHTNDDDDDDDDNAFDEEDDDDDGVLDSFETIVDNDAAELELLKEKARQQAAADSKQNIASTETDLENEAENAPSWASSLTIKIGVGLALALVARLVLIRKKPISNEDSAAEIIMKRRLTIATPEENIPEHIEDINEPLPEDEIKPKTGGGPQSLEDDDLFEQELRRANDEMMRERYEDALISFDWLIQKYPHEPQVYLGKAQTLDHYAEKLKSNSLLSEAITLYKTYLEFTVADNQLQEYRSAAERCLERLRFLGNYQQSLSIHHLLIKKFPRDPSLRNELVVTYLISDRLLDAKRTLHEILQLWPQDGLALVHYGFVLKQLDHDYYNASIYLRKGIESNAQGTQHGRFYLHLGESLQRLGRQSEAVEVFRKGADLKLFPSVYQRSLYNEANLRAQPFWSLEETTYEKFWKKLEDNWLAIQAEGLNILSKTGYFVNETENLMDKGAWKQFDLYSRGQQRRDNCLKAPITCSLIAQFPAARDCRRGQVKFSVMHPDTHVWPHCGPTNCRLRAHLGLKVPTGTRIRVAEEEHSWQEGKLLIFDDSFEHEVWHEGQDLRLILIVDVWHPQLTEQQRRSLTHI